MLWEVQRAEEGEENWFVGLVSLHVERACSALELEFWDQGWGMPG